ncbi:hypothetical protein [Actinoplanes sp. NPDC051411]|uniref:hypothetical protein n=1 Tax=Actinoplanes sp. NPDC051411 TaxID=3155522 RepID=UPI00343011FD
MSAFDPREAADLLDSIERDARRRFDPRPPLVGLFSAVVVLAIYGTLWLSVRDQHPYVGPTDTATAWAYTILAASVVVSMSTYRRATHGITGRSRREDAISGLVIGVPWAAVYVFNAALQANGAGDNIVHGVFDAAGPWVVVGAAVAGVAAGRGQRGGIAVGLAAVVIGTVAAFFGPAGAWGVLGVAGCAGLLIQAAARFVALRLA